MDQLFKIFKPDLLIHLVTVLGWIAGLSLLVYLIRKALKLWFSWRQKTVCLELTPPAHTDRPVGATDQLITALHGLASGQSWIRKLLGLNNVLAFEIVSTRAEGIRYILRCAKAYAPVIEQMIASYTPDVKLRTVPDYISKTDLSKATVLEFRQKQHYAYPLKNQEELGSHDPLSYITNAMTKLDTGELMAFQLVIAPVKLRSAVQLSYKIMNNEDLLPKLKGTSLPGVSSVFRLINTILFGILDLFTTAYHGPSKADYSSSQKDMEYKKQVAKRLKPVRTLSYFEHELVESIHQKLAQPLFTADVRVLISAKSKEAYKNRKKSIASALSVYAVANKQQFAPRRAKHLLMPTYSHFLFQHRLASLFRTHQSILSASEVSSLYHFTHSLSAKTANVVKSLSKTLPAPVSLKNGQKLDVLLGQNIHHGVTTPIGLTDEERQRHIYIIGGTGNGKTTMLMYAIVQDIKNGKGVAVLDPHGDLAETILHHIPKERIKDVIYLNPDDLARPIGINLLELAPGLTGDDLLREKDLITESAISVLRKIFSEDDSGGHRIEYVLRNAIQTALTLEEPTLFTIFRLLNDNKFRRSVTNNLEDKDLKNFWDNELGKAGGFQKVKMSAGITAKIGRFLFSASAKRILEQPKSSIDFEDILNSGKILICNFSKGLLGEDTSTLFGTTVLAKLQVAALRRARIKQVDRRPYHLYVDEFQNFATTSFVEMLSEARKYKLYLTMAEQSTTQQDQERLVEIILANVGTVVCFRSGSPVDERLMLPLFRPYIDEGEIANLPSYNFYARIAAVNAQEPMSGITVLLDNEGIEQVAKAVIEHSRQQYGAKKVIKEIVEVVADEQPKQTRRRRRTIVSKAGANKPLVADKSRAL